jgi:hypothetical protein
VIVAAVRAALLIGSAMAFVHAVPVGTAGPQAHGRELVAEFQLPDELVAQYRERGHGGSAPRAAQTSWADPTLWSGAASAAGVGRNPYTLVLTASGSALAAGDVRTHWHAGWEVRESPTASRELLMPLAALSSGTVAAGTPLTLTAVSGPVSFRGEREVAPMLNLVRAQNFDLQNVRVAVWSGSAPWAGPRWPSLALALTLLAAWLALGRRDPRAAAAPIATTPVRPLSGSGEAAGAPADIDLDALSILPSAAPDAPSAASAMPQAPAASTSSRVIDALRDVLTAGLAVPTQFDVTRRGKRRQLHLDAARPTAGS